MVAGEVSHSNQIIGSCAGASFLVLTLHIISEPIGRIMEVKVLDGGCSTELGDYINTDPLWSSRLLLTNPEGIKKVHRSFLDHGADIIQTMSYQGSVPNFIKHAGVSADEATSLLKYSVQLVKDAVEEFCKEKKLSTGNNNIDDKPRPLVCGSVGPYATVYFGNALEYSGTYIDEVDEQTIIDFQRHRIQALLDGGVDVLALETIPVQKEAEAMAKLMREFPNAKSWIAFSCKDDQHVCHGEKFSEAVSSVAAMGTVKTIGVNCSQASYVTPLLKSAQSVRKDGISFVAYPNSGEVFQNLKWNGTRILKDIPGLVREWVDLGATVVGGCCRTTPQDVQDIADAVYQMRPGL